MGRFKVVLIHSIKRATGTHQLYIGMNQKVKHHSENNVDLKKYFQWLFTRIYHSSLTYFLKLLTVQNQIIFRLLLMYV